MNIFLSHNTALQVWRRIGIRLPLVDAHSIEKAFETPCLGASEIESLIDRLPLLQGLPRPLDVVVPEVSKRRHSDNIRTHVHDRLTTPFLFCQLAPGVYVSAPELCLLQLAKGMNFAELIELGFELCGTYSLPAIKSGKLEHHDALCGVAHLADVASMSHGSATAWEQLGRAAEYILEGSDSPMETAQAMLVTLPHRMGGYGLGRPLLNATLIVPLDLRIAAGRNTLRPDMYWPDFHVALEYDSKLWHEKEEQHGHDSARTSILELMGVGVVSNTPFQMFDSARMDAVYNNLLKKMKLKQRIRAADFGQKKEQLRNCILEKWQSTGTG